MTKNFFILLIIFLYITNGKVDSRIEVHVVDALPNNDIPLSLHCASKDDDLGYHYPKVGDDFHFHFYPKLFGHTLFFCHFWWGKKDAAFDVYTYELSPNCSWDDRSISYCYWKVQEDGFYMGPSLNEVKKMHDWN
uniref:S-protein homolog n=1 Tax=Solanum lycopersicum TaxID=4081 RepID=A0A3Q7GPG1_SOLLC